MIDGVNEVRLMGYLGKDPALSYTQSGTARCRFSMATSKRYTDGAGNKQTKTEWHNIVVWGKQGESSGKYLKKGSLVYIEGEIEYRSWDDRESGQKKNITEIKANRVTFLPSSGEGRTGAGESSRREAPPGNGPSNNGDSGAPGDDDIPF